MYKKLKINKGFSIIEVLLAVSVFGLLVSALSGIYFYGQESGVLSGKRNRAVSLAEEGIEAVRNIRDANFANLNDGTYGLSKSGSSWVLTPVPDTTGAYTRAININSTDADHKEITSTVTWQQNATRSGSVSIVSKLNYWTRIISTADWAKPLLTSSLNLAGNNNGFKLQVKGDYVYLIRNAGTPNLYILNISNLNSPSLVGSIALSGTLRNIYTDGGYVYVTSNSNNQELQIVDVSNPAAPFIAGTYDAAGTSDANGVYVAGNYAYMAKASSTSHEFFVVDITNPALPALAGSVDLGTTGYELVTSGGFAYVTSANNTQEVKVINISTPGSPTVQANLNLTGNNDATVIGLYNSTTLVVGQNTSFYTISIVNPLAPSVLGTVNISAIVNDISLESNTSGEYVYLATSDNADEFQVVDVSDKVNPVNYGSYDQTGLNVLNGVAYMPGIDKAFAASSSNTQEFIILEPQ